MDVRLEPQVEGRSKERVVFTGTILPATKDRHNSIEHCCEEFTTEEVGDLCNALQGLPLCLEHGDGLDGRPNLAVGSVLKAWQSDDGSVRVMCSIDHSTDLADHVRKNVLNRQLPDLSLSHSYEMFLDGNNKVALVKSPIEVSVCSMGAREGAKCNDCRRRLTRAVGTHILDRAVMACSRNQTESADYITKPRKIKYVGVFRASMAESSEVVMAEAPVENVAAPAVESAPAPAPAPAEVTEPVATETKPAAEPPVEAVQQPAVAAETQPAVSTADASALLSMNRQQLAEFTAKVTSDASMKVDEANKQMAAQQEELAMLRAEHQKRLQQEQDQQRQAFEQKMQELKAEGFNQDGLLMGIETMAKTDMGNAMNMLSNIVAASRAKEEERQRHIAAMEAKKEADVKAHFEEAAASYKRLLSGAVMASSESKKPRTTAAPAAPAVQTTIKPHQSTPAPAATPVPAPAAVKPAVATMPACRTYMEANALLNRKAGTVQASALGRTPMRSVREFNLTPTDEQRGLHGLQHFNQPLYEELLGTGSVTNVAAAMHQTATFLRSRSMW